MGSPPTRTRLRGFSGIEQHLGAQGRQDVEMDRIQVIQALSDGRDDPAALGRQQCAVPTTLTPSESARRRAARSSRMSLVALRSRASAMLSLSPGPSDAATIAGGTVLASGVGTIQPGS